MSKKSTTKNAADFRQLYKKNWEALPIFQGWLAPVVGNSYRAICKFCSKEFRAHRTDLRMHARSVKHKNAASNFYENEKNREKDSDVQIRNTLEIETRPVSPEPTSSTFQNETILNVEERTEEVMCADEENSCADASDVLPAPQLVAAGLPRSLEQQMVNVHKKSIISTKVEDTVKGVPVDRLVIYLFVLRNNEWTKFGKGITSKDGLCTNFVMFEDEESNAIVPGQYKLRYETKMHFTLNLDESIFPHIEVSIEISDISDSYHVHLLISPFGFMVFRNNFT